MASSPSVVVVHFRTVRGQRVIVPRTYSEAAHRRLIVKPGMATEARDCHTKVSTTARVTLVLRPASGLGTCWAQRHLTQLGQRQETSRQKQESGPGRRREQEDLGKAEGSWEGHGLYYIQGRGWPAHTQERYQLSPPSHVG